MTIETVWARLGSIRNLTFKASSPTSTGWNGAGFGNVDVSHAATDVIVYSETGKWTPTGGKQLSFTNSYRWTINIDASTIRLDHLRFGSDKPVYLFDLGILDDNCMASIDPYN